MSSVVKTQKIERLIKAQKEHEERSKKIDNLKKAYTQYELGEIDKDQICYIIKTEIGGNDTGKLKDILSKPQLDKKNFKNILYNTDLIEHRQPEIKFNRDYDGKYNKYKRVKPEPKSYASKYENNAHLKDSATRFTQGVITPDEFREQLRTEGINPNIEPINKFIRAKEEGNNVSYSN